MLPYPGEKIRPEDPDYWSWRYAFWSMRRHPGIALLMLVWSLSVTFVFGSLLSLPVVLVVREWVGRARCVQQGTYSPLFSPGGA